MARAGGSAGLSRTSPSPKDLCQRTLNKVFGAQGQSPAKVLK